MREFATEANADKVVFYSGRLAVEDFNEMLVLSGNGYGAGALKLLRGMFERLVTAHYVHTHPTEADNFLDYFWVSQQKVLQVIKENFGADVLNKDLVEEVDTNYRRVKDKFMIPHCDECPKTRLNHNWTRMDIVSMAKVDGMFGKYLVDAYYVPLREAHSTAAAILSRLDIVGDTVRFEFRPQRKLADAALITSHRLLCLISSSNNNTSSWKISKKHWPAAGATLRRYGRRDKSVSFRGDAVPKCGMTRRTRS